MNSIRWKLALLVLGGCNGSATSSMPGASGDDGGASDAAANADGGAGPAQPDSCAQAPPDVSIRMLNQLAAAGSAPAIAAYDVGYTSTDGTRVHGQICVPASAGPHPIAVFNHGGATGLGLNEWGAHDGNQCQSLAGAGYVAVMAQYRGEADKGTSAVLGNVDIASGGTVEMCGREIDDVLSLLTLAQKRCDVSPEHVVMYGVSHGGCLGLQAARRHPTGLRAVAAFVAPTDLAALYRYHRDHAAGGSAPPDACPVDQHEALADLLLASAGDPATNPAAYTERSPLAFASDIATMPTFLVYGGADCLVPPLTHGCPFRKALGDAGASFIDLHVDASGQSTLAPVASCDGPTFTSWTASTTFTSDHYFVFLDGQPHGLDAPGTTAPLVLAAAGSFLLAHH